MAVRKSVLLEVGGFNPDGIGDKNRSGSEAMVSAD